MLHAVQIYRALRPAPSNEACSAMLTCLFKCVASPSQVPLEMAVDILLTLQVSLASLLAASGCQRLGQHRMTKQTQLLTDSAYCFAVQLASLHTE